MIKWPGLRILFFTAEAQKTKEFFIKVTLDCIKLVKPFWLIILYIFIDIAVSLS